MVKVLGFFHPHESEYAGQCSAPRSLDHVKLEHWFENMLVK